MCAGLAGTTAREGQNSSDTDASLPNEEEIPFQQTEEHIHSHTYTRTHKHTHTHTQKHTHSCMQIDIIPVVIKPLVCGKEERGEEESGGDAK